MRRTEYQVNLHFGEHSLSAFNFKKGAVFARSLGWLVRRIVKKHGLKAEEIAFTFQPEDCVGTGISLKLNPSKHRRTDGRLPRERSRHRG